MSSAAYRYRQDHIPLSTPYNRRPGLAMTPTTITIHNTGNLSSTAANERAWLTNPTNTRTASYHIVIDAIEAIEVLPLNETAWHAGDGSKATSGNRTSIGIEICERNTLTGEYAQTLRNAVELVAKLLTANNWSVDRLRRHYDWSGKNCPRLMNQDGKWTGWKQFVQQVDARLLELKTNKSTEANKSEIATATVIVNGKQLPQKGEVKAGVTYVPIRAVAEALGATVKWNSSTQTVTVTQPEYGKA
ncbi:N-acetylmuramoyl-L-alanine amidase [Paenibacillus septentrionalis]|uniref:N-acetylmuramoyl-L-alanine amidase n=1 Tax=Paenibacillus septentrionalis TaxID=429342 RepID=A0ABW1V755_9BACL